MLTQTLADLTEATRLASAPPLAFRSIGLVHRQRQDLAAAAQAFEQYLLVAPEAADATLIRNYISELKL